MLSIKTSADLARAIDGPLDPALKQLLQLRRDQLLQYSNLDFGDVAHLIIAEPGDTLLAIEAAAGVPLATNLVDGSKLGQPGFTDNFEFVAHHPGGWLEAVLILSDDGFGVGLFVPNHGDIDPELLALLRQHG